MTEGEHREPAGTGLPSPPSGAPPADAPPPPPPVTSTRRSASAPPVDDGIGPAHEPELPSAPAAAHSLAASGQQQVRGTWYRSDQDRFKSVHRRANPWYRRLARGIVALCLLAALGFAIFLVAREADDYLARDRLPAPGADIPDFRATSFEVRSSPPAPGVDGTITIDVQTGAFEFVARPTGLQSGIQVVSPDGARTYLRQDAGTWRVADGDDPVVADVRTAVAYLIDLNDVDDLFTSRLRDYVELIGRETEGAGENELTRYEMTIDTAGYSDDFPLQWTTFRRRAVPGVEERAALPVTMWIDGDDVIVRLLAADHWEWERLTYVDTTFRPDDPAESLLDATVDEATTDEATTDEASDG